MTFISSSEDVRLLKSKLHPEILTLGRNLKCSLAPTTLRLVSVLVCDSVLSSTYADADDCHKNRFRSSTVSSGAIKLMQKSCKGSVCLFEIPSEMLLRHPFLT